MKAKVAVGLWVVLFVTGVSALGAGQTGASAPLSESQIRGLIAGGVFNGRIAELVQERGIDFMPTEDELHSLKDAGAGEVVLRALRQAKVLPPSGVQAREDAKRELTSAENAERAKEWASAEEEYRAALAAEPGNPSAHNGLGRVLRAEGKRQEAMSEFRQAVRLDPSASGPHEALASALAESGDDAGAVREYREALRLSPGGDPAAEAQLAALLYSTGDLSGATAAYRDLERRSPGDAQVHYRLGLALYADGNLEDATAEFRDALRIKPGLPEAHAALGDALLKQGDRLGALEEYQKSLAGQPGQPASPDIRAALTWLAKNLATPGQP